MLFADLFSGLGGFHIALKRLGYICAFASEADEDLCDIYEKNFGLRPVGDIRNINANEVPPHDILCAGFPCQPFSKAGEQLGAKCPRWGDLFNDHVLRIIKYHKPKFIMLENVPNLERHNRGQTWLTMKDKLRSFGYEIDAKILSPHRFGIPQIRERMFIVGSFVGLDNFNWPKEINQPVSIYSVLENNPKGAKRISNKVEECLQVWQEFLDRSPRDDELPSFPIWTMEFGATYPYTDTTPFALGTRRLRKYQGSHGYNLAQVSPKERFEHLPSYARAQNEKFPMWKIKFIQQNRDYFEKNRSWIDPWLPKILKFPPSWQKFEWNCKGEVRDIWQYIIQFRASGVRVKRPTTAPSLVAMTTTQVPIIASERRYMTLTECKRLQGMESLEYLPRLNTKAYKAFGNAVNVKIVELISQALLCDAGSKPLSDQLHTHSFNQRLLKAVR